MLNQINRIGILGLCLSVVSCGPDSVQRASDDPWSSKQQSIKSLNEISGLPQAPMVVHGETVRAKALSILDQAAFDDNPRIRANTIEALRWAPVEKLNHAVRAGLADENLGVRFVAAMMVGEAKLCDLALLLEPILLDESQSVQAAVLCSLYRCGHQVDLNPIAKMLESDNPELRGNAAMVLGMMGNKSAVDLIRRASQTAPDSIPSIRRRLINLQMAEALVKLGEDSELGVIRAAIFSSIQEAEITALACQISGRIKDIQILSTLESIAMTPERYPDEIRLVASTAIAEIAPDKVPTEIVLRFTSSKLSKLRAQSATTLGIQGNQVNLGPLAQMMKDSDPLVQIAASGAVLRIDNGDSLAIVH